LSRPGFIHDKLDIKFLILYITARAAAPLDFPTLIDLTMCDEGVDYFEFAEAVSELVSTGHLQVDENHLYSITEKGRTNGSICESSLAYSVRTKADRQLLLLNAKLRRDAQVRAEVIPRPGGSLSVRLSLEDHFETIMTLELMADDDEQAEQLVSSFRDRAEQVYNIVLAALLEAPDQTESDPED
jgi:hypothetical protein